ncbi:MAG: type II toxin-antitoxin system VapC family toxin [Candidatus Sulfopaludibacter sp.]|nr:type II toxin-antitoxin system VapC family toxin [Candidatus Sulfopaludibacter sp.]
MTRGYLLDTHTFLWALQAPEKLSRKARRICESPTKPLILSPVSFWELIAKCEAGKLDIPAVGTTLPLWAERLGARMLPLEAKHVLALYGLPVLHSDTFDRVLIAQALVEDLVIVTKDEDVQGYPGLHWIW